MRAAQRQKTITRGPLELVRGARSSERRPPDPPLPRYLNQEELARFRKAVLAEGNARDVALFATMYRLGLRGIEATELLLEDLDLHRGRIRVRRAKHGEAKEYPLAQDLVPILRRYLRKRTERGPFLFTGRESNNQRGLIPLRVRQLFKHYAKAAGLPPRVSSHALRHSIAVHSLEEGFGLEYVADLLGHRSTRSTAIYARITTPAREEMMRRLDKSRFVVSWR